MNLRQLEVLHAIFKAGSVTGAARDLNVTQPAVSAVLKHLEQRLQFKLFERVSGRLRPTPEAEALMPDVAEIFGRVDTLGRMAHDMRDGTAGRLVVASSPTLIDSLIPQAVVRFRRQQLGVSIVLWSLPTPLAVERVVKRELDMGLVYGPILDDAVVVEDLMTSEIVCAMPQSHTLAAQAHVAVGDLAGQAVISLGASTRLGRAIDKQCIEAGVAPPIIGVEASSSVTACLLVREGAGIALVDRTAALSSAAADLVFRTLYPSIRVSVHLIHPRGRPRSRASLQFGAHVHAIARAAGL